MEIEIIQNIQVFKVKKILMDFQLADIYKIETKVLNQQVRRNLDSFPEDFMFQLTTAELKNLISQNVTSSWGGRRKLPFTFTEHGAVMLASILKSKLAIKASTYVVRAFVQIRDYMDALKELARKLEALKSKYDHQFSLVFDAIKQLIHEKMNPDI